MRVKLPAKLNDSVVLETVGQKQIVDSKCTFRQHIFIPVIESMIGELEARFSGHSNSVMLGIQCLNPSDESFLDLVKMFSSIDIHGGDMEDLTHEVYQVKKLLQRTKPVPD